MCICVCVCCFVVNNYGVSIGLDTSTKSVCHVYCNGDENKVTDCDIQLGCSCHNVAGVDCSK